MAATIAGMSLSTATVVAKTHKPNTQSPLKFSWLQCPWKKTSHRGRQAIHLRLMATPERIAEKVEESIKKAEETCAGDAASGECAAAWDEVEEVSAAASHAREKQKGSDPLEDYCKDNPETEECKTYDN